MPIAMSSLAATETTPPPHRRRCRSRRRRASAGNCSYTQRRQGRLLSPQEGAHRSSQSQAAEYHDDELATLDDRRPHFFRYLYLYYRCTYTGGSVVLLVVLWYGFPPLLTPGVTPCCCTDLCLSQSEISVIKRSRKVSALQLYLLILLHRRRSL